ncbi:MAG: CPBP family intramembrane metalloprotease [Candidatus Hydrogenedentes bacterium]|nr:CPBP family intramembrane metalloprotease [Candidatus Hydrogenedentota bacterium]
MEPVEREAASRPAPAHVVAAALALVGLLYVSWIGAWVLEQWLEAETPLLGTRAARFVFWIIMKALFWILPAWLLARYCGRSTGEVFALHRVRAIALWGGGTGLLLGGIALITKNLSGQPLLSLELNLSLLSGALIAPLVEEYTFRGAVLGALQARLRFHTANLLTALFFVGAHFPGWYFQDRLLANLVNPVGGALSIFLLGLVFGYVVHRSKSVAAGALTHMLNNLFSG